MSTATQQTEVRAVYITCRLGKSELNRLFSLAPEGIPAADVHISTQRDSTRYSASTLPDLVDHVRSSNASGNLDKWDNIQLEAADTSGDRKISIKIDTERVEAQVSGTDATWVHGQAARIELLLKGAGGSIKNEQKEKKDRKELLVFIACTAPPVMLAFYAANQLFPAPEVKPKATLENTAAQYITMAIIAAVALLAKMIVKRANRAVLQPTADIPHGSWWSRASNTDKIGLGTLAVAFLALIVAALTLSKDLLK
ncbi:hypothetical protein [Streptomyces hydrogenans]|uniref:hypothetical protein n=1 Tax=Streptomyces hydrogenans TaxID=1873719 RepID=UPI0037FDD990